MLSEGTLLAGDVAARIPTEIKGLVLSGVVGATLKEALVYMAGDGAFLMHRRHSDANGDATITLQEFEADPKGIRKQLSDTVGFGTLDVNKDGVYVADDLKASTKSLRDAIAAEDFAGFERWMRTNAGVPVPEPMRDWVADHFRHPPMWDVVSRLTMPVGFFHGEMDANTPIDGVKALEQSAKAAGKSNFEFHYFPGLDHQLDRLDYFTRGAPSAGYSAIFDFLKRHTGRR